MGEGVESVSLRSVTTAVLLLCLTTSALTALLASAGGAQTTEVVRLSEHPTRLVRVYAGGGACLPVSNLADQTKAGYSGTLAVGFIPTFLSSGDIEVVLRGQYDLLPTASNRRPDVSFMSVGVDWKLNLDPRQPTNVYFVVGGGFTHTIWHEVDKEDFRVPEFTQNHLYGSGGLGIEFLRKGVSPWVEFRLANVTGERMGNYYFFRLSAGLKL